ncbi:MAG: DUF4199 domain-containing protein [Ekhidna sp.]|nr:DUF4199 domain-containing protein [Ekhidna sp.]
MKSIEKHVLRYGLLTTIALICYFLLMRLLGLAEITELRSLNALIMFSGVFLTIKKFRNGDFDTAFGYLSGIAVGFFTGIVIAISFSLFIGIYIYFDPVFLAAIVADNPQKDFLNPLTAAMVIFIEAIASGFLFSYAAMQWLKEDKVV